MDTSDSLGVGDPRSLHKRLDDAQLKVMLLVCGGGVCFFFKKMAPEAYKEKNYKFLQIPSNEFLQMESFERFSAMKFL
jgi:hypothetical protein